LKRGFTNHDILLHMDNSVTAFVKTAMLAAALVHFSIHCLLDKEKQFSKTVATWRTCPSL